MELSLGALMGIFFVNQSLRQRNTERDIKGALVLAAFCFIYGVVAPHLMSTLVATIRDSYLIG
jgi:hypothetical protein